MSTRRPLTRKWPWRMSWRACRREPRGREAETGDDVVEPHLQQPQEVLAGDAGLAAGLLVVAAELRLEHAVEPARLLLLPQLEEVLALADAPPPALARRVVAALDGALVGEAALALEEELLALPTALLALRAAIAGHAGS
jgi:hypothetical protein